MAKTSTTKAKTKTAKKTSITKDSKPAVKAVATAKTESVATATSAKAVVKSEVKKTKRARKPLTAAGLRKWHSLSIVVFLALAVIAAAVMKAATFTVSIGHLTKNELASTSSTVFTNAQHNWFDLDVRYALIAMLVISVLLHFGRSRRMWAAEKAGIESRILPWRWFDAAVTGAIAVEITALVAGLGDMVSVKALGLLTVVSVVFAWIAERENAGSAKAVRAPFMASVATGFSTAVLLYVPIVATLVYGAVRPTWYVFALWATVALTFLLTGWVQWKAYKHGKVWNYLYIERNYLVINFLSKVAFAAILIVAFHK